MIELDHLNAVQRDAALHQHGPMLLLAGAGSGKTRVVTHRIARLLDEGETPSSILAVTFTNKAAKEMKDRVLELLEVDSVPGMTVCTFHSLGARLLRWHAAVLGRTRDFVIYDDKDSISALKAVVEQLGVEKGAAPLVKAARKAIDQAKNEGLPASAMELPVEFTFFEGVQIDPAELGAKYDASLAQSNAFDFGDLVRCAADLLVNEAAIGAHYRSRWNWVLVDEFQDTNAAQYRLLQALAPPPSNLFVVGDDDQSIYGWRGAEVENILGFDKVYPTAQVLRLEQNYRSEGNILDAANAVIGHNTRRLGKSLWTDRPAGAGIEILTATDGRTEARMVANRIMALRAEGIRPGEIAVLYRANHLSLDLEQALQLRGVPHVIVRGRSFYERAEVRDAMAYLRLLVNPQDDVAFRRAVNTPSRGVGDVSVRRVSEEADRTGRSLLEAVPDALPNIRGKAKAGLTDFCALIGAVRQIENPLTAARTVLTDAGVVMGLVGLSEDDRDRQENILRLLDALGDHLDGVDPEASLSSFVEQVKLISALDVAELEGGAVSLLTTHASKGLEWRAVFVVGLEEEGFPSQRAVDEGRVEEERRLFYVAVTRARERLVLSHAERRRLFGGQATWRRPSRFLGELPVGALDRPAPRQRPAAPKQFSRRPAQPRAPQPRPVAVEDFSQDASDAAWAPGMHVWHQDFGVGRVCRVRVGMRGVMLTVDFEDKQRTIVADFVSLYEG
ncbi:MAG: DNA helicase-2/ATP-dependent DNA helicase PcrA [Bradymonadia bacterium]